MFQIWSYLVRKIYLLGNLYNAKALNLESFTRFLKGIIPKIKQANNYN